MWLNSQPLPLLSLQTYLKHKITLSSLKSGMYSYILVYTGLTVLTPSHPLITPLLKLYI